MLLHFSSDYPRRLIVILATVCAGLGAGVPAWAVAPRSSAPSHNGTGAIDKSAKPASEARGSVHKSAKPASKPSATTSTPVTTVGGPAEPLSAPTSATNPNDSLVNNDVLSLTDPACGLSGMTVEQASRCLRTGDPSVPYPLGNYQMDIHMGTGVTHPVNDVLTILEAMMNVVWLLLLYILKGALTLTGWAFSLSPFTNTATLGSAQSKLESVYKALDGAWLDSVFVAIGGYAAYVGFVRRRQSEAVGHLGASVAAILLAMAIIHAPRTFVGKPAGFVNGFAQDAISSANLAAQNQSGTVPNSKLASLTGDLFDTFATGPFCALETNDVHWCMSRPTAIEMKAVGAAMQEDHAYETQAKAIAADVAGRLPQGQQSKAYKAVYESLNSASTSATRAALFLRYPPGSIPRETLYSLYSGETQNNLVAKIIANQKALEGTPAAINITLGPSIAAALAGSILKKGIGVFSSIYGGGGSKNTVKPLAPNKIAIQGSSGLVQRCLVLLLTVIALVGVLLVLVWLAVHLLIQALLGFVLLLATPIMMLSPAFGAGGRKAFGSWAKTLFGAIASKAFYAAFLGVFVLALTALQEASSVALGPTTHLGVGALANTATKGVGQGGILQAEGGGSGAGGWGVPWVMQCLLCWAVFFKRNKIVGFFAIDPTTHQQSGSASMTGMRVMGAAYAAHRLGGVVAGAASRPINAYRTNASERAVGREEATRELAYGELEGQELGAATRSHGRHGEREGTYKNALDNTQGQIDRIRQNPDYKKYTAWKQSQDTHEGVFGAPKTHGPHQPPKPTTEERGRGEAMAARLSKLESGKSVLAERHAQARDIVRHGERNLREHGEVLSPSEVSSRVEARRNSLASNSGDPHAWKRAENLELASGKPLTPERVRGLEQDANNKNSPARAASAKAELDSTRRQVTARMEASERLLQGVPTRSQFETKRAPGSSATAEQEISRVPHRRAELDRLADTRIREMKRQRYLRRRHVYRS